MTAISCASSQQPARSYKPPSEHPPQTHESPSLHSNSSIAPESLPPRQAIRKSYSQNPSGCTTAPDRRQQLQLHPSREEVEELQQHLLAIVAAFTFAFALEPVRGREPRIRQYNRTARP